MVIRRGDCVNIREPCRKGHSISVPPTRVVLTGAAQTHLIMLSASSLGARGREDGSLGKDAICGNCTDVPLCSDTILTAGFGSMQAAVQRVNGISMMTPSQRLSGVNVCLCGTLCFPLSFDFTISHLHNDLNAQEKHAASSFCIPFSISVCTQAHERKCIRSTLYFLLSPAKSDAISLLN